MSTMTIERRQKLEDHIVYAYLFKHAGIGHGSNGWDFIYGPVGDSPCIFAKPSLTGVNGGFEINWFIPNEHGNESQPYKLYIAVGTNTPLADAKDRIEELDKALADACDDIEEWKSNTCCDTPTEARKHIEELMQENSDLQVKLEGKERCDNVDALMYAYCEMKKTKEESHTLEKDKNCIEFSMRSMMATHKPYQEDTEITIAGLAPGKSLLLANNPFDIPCDVVVVSKRYFERLQAANEQLKKDNRLLKDRNGHFGDTIKKERAYVLELQKEIAAWQDATSCKLPKEAESRIINLLNDHGIDTLRIDSLKKRIAVWERSADYWGNKFAEWKKATECDTPEEAKKRIDGILDDLSKADDDIIDLGVEIKKLQDRLKANKYNKLWITSNGMLFSESDKTVEALEVQVDKLNNEINEQVSHINELDARIKELSNVISQWTSETGFKDPVVCGHYINCLKKDVIARSDLISDLAKKVADHEDRCMEHQEQIKSLHKNIESWKKATGYETPKEAEKKIKLLVEDIDVLMRSKEG